MSKLEKFRITSDLTMKALILCDDFAFAARVNATLQRVGRLANVGVQWVIKCRLTSALNQPALAAEALIEAENAHLIVLPVQRAQAFPSWLRDWLERWAALRQISDAALAVIRDDNKLDATKPINSELPLFVRRHGLNLLVDGSQVAHDAVNLFVRFARERELLLPVVTSHHPSLIVRGSYRGVGINE